MPDSSAVIEHLTYHKALLDSDIDMDYYITLVRDMENGIHLIAKNPVDKAVAILFELVMGEKINPWKIDLVKFGKIYMERIKNEREIDFIIAGKIIYMAWNILMRKSEQVLDKATIEEDEEVIETDFESFDDLDLEPQDIYYNAPEIKLKEPVRREETRPVSLFDLIEAIHEVRAEIEKKKIKKKIREKFKFNLEEKVHREDMEEEIREVWGRLCEVQGDEIALTLLYDGTREDFTTIFLSLLFLEKFGKVELQQYVPYEDIYIRIKVPQELRTVEFMPVPKVFIEEL